MTKNLYKKPSQKYTIVDLFGPPKGRPFVYKEEKMLIPSCVDHDYQKMVDLKDFLGENSRGRFV